MYDLLLRSAIYNCHPEYSYGCDRVSKQLQAAAKNRERFPLKLFGFVITTQLLATWVGLAAAPIMTSAKTVAPPMISVGCRLARGGGRAPQHGRRHLERFRQDIRTRRLRNVPLWASERQIFRNNYHAYSYSPSGRHASEPLERRFGFSAPQSNQLTSAWIALATGPNLVQTTLKDVRDWLKSPQTQRNRPKFDRFRQIFGRRLSRFGRTPPK